MSSKDESTQASHATKEEQELQDRTDFINTQIILNEKIKNRLAELENWKNQQNIRNLNFVSEANKKPSKFWSEKFLGVIQLITVLVLIAQAYIYSGQLQEMQSQNFLQEKNFKLAFWQGRFHEFRKERSFRDIIEEYSACRPVYVSDGGGTYDWEIHHYFTFLETLVKFALVSKSEQKGENSSTDEELLKYLFGEIIVESIFSPSLTGWLTETRAVAGQDQRYLELEKWATTTKNTDKSLSKHIDNVVDVCSKRRNIQEGKK